VPGRRDSSEVSAGQVGRTFASAVLQTHSRIRQTIDVRSTTRCVPSHIAIPPSCRVRRQPCRHHQAAARPSREEPGSFREKIPVTQDRSNPQAIKSAFGFLLRANDSRGAGRSGRDIGRRRRRRHHGRGRRRVLMHIDTAGEGQECQWKQEGNAHRTDPSVGDNEPGSICPVPWPVRAAFVAGSWRGITTGWAGSIVDDEPPNADH
jgi:hypothetical protein